MPDIDHYDVKRMIDDESRWLEDRIQAVQAAVVDLVSRVSALEEEPRELRPS